MKKINQSLLLLLIASGTLLISSCKKEEEAPVAAATTPTPASTAYKFSYKVDGTIYNPTNYVCQYYNTNSMKGIYINLYGVTVSPISLRIQENNISGTYPLSSSVIAVYNPTINDNFFGTTGSIVISSVGSGKVSGTFSFTGEASGVTHIITEGVFENIPY